MALAGLFDHDDRAALSAAQAALEHVRQLPNERFVIPEASPVAKGTGRSVDQDGIKQFPRAAGASPVARELQTEQQGKEA
jgi:hypothetical protein